MGDFIVDFRDPANRCNDGSVLQFCTGIEVDEIRRDSFTLLVSRVGSRDLWGTFEADDGLAVALAGRVALEEEAWRSAQNAPGRGGLACKAIYQAYKQGGPARVGELSGSYARLKELWQRPNPIARELIHEVTGRPADPEPSHYSDRPTTSGLLRKCSSCSAVYGVSSLGRIQFAVR